MTSPNFPPTLSPSPLQVPTTLPAQALDPDTPRPCSPTLWRCSWCRCRSPSGGSRTCWRLDGHPLDGAQPLPQQRHKHSLDGTPRAEEMRNKLNKILYDYDHECPLVHLEEVWIDFQQQAGSLQLWTLHSQKISHCWGPTAFRTWNHYGWSHCQLSLPSMNKDPAKQTPRISSASAQSFISEHCCRHNVFLYTGTVCGKEPCQRQVR